MRLRGYLMENYSALRDYRTKISGEKLMGLGVAKGNVNKLFADMMKKRGMSWTRQGANRMARVISLSRSGKLDTRSKISTGKSVPTPASTSCRSQSAKYEAEDDSTHLRASLSALHGPYADRP